MIFRVSDITPSKLLSEQYDLAIFAAGYEERCVNLASQLSKGAASKILLMGFAEHVETEQRRLNSAALSRIIGSTEISIPYDNDELVLEALRSVTLPSDPTIKVLVDYSAMSRTWFNAILNFFKFGKTAQTVHLTFAYTVGEHQDLARESWRHETDYSIREVVCLPGLEGGPTRHQRTVAVIGLGFEWSPPFGICELLEPDALYAFIADPGSFENYGEVALTRNSNFLNEYVKTEPLRLPLRSVERSFQTLAELILPLRHDADVVLVPLGPKPLVLTSILLASRFRELTCLYAKGSRRKPVRVRAAAPRDIVATCVEVRREIPLQKKA